MELDVIKDLSFIIVSIFFAICCFFGSITFYRMAKLTKLGLKRLEGKENE